jgi:3-phenylpropionate/cinnamic acid dioxygenase small subunit
MSMASSPSRTLVGPEASAVTPEIYERLLDDARSFAEEAEPVDGTTRDEAVRLVNREARLLDQGRFEQWLELFAADGIYWIPHVAGGGDPRREVSIAFDDRRRLGDRIARVRAGLAWSQIPPSRTCHQLTNLEVWRGASDDAVVVRSTFVVHEIRGTTERSLAGWAGHRLGRESGGWKIVVKQVNLLGCDRGLENMSLIL